MEEPYDLAPDDRADVSVRKILRRLFVTLRSNANGLTEDANTKCLHDLRVANRRTRSALSQIKGVLPVSVIEYFQPEFKWLGNVTGPCRDLDVFLNTLDGPRGESGDLGHLRNFLSEKRQREHILVCAALRTEKFQRLVDDWGRFLETAADEEIRPRLASSPIIEVAGPRILKAYRRMWNRGTGIDVDPPATLLHRLRIDGKKLRYLLEFFIELYSMTTVSRFIGELKKLQDILGDLNDTRVQLALISEFKNQGIVSPEEFAASSLLAKMITQRQCELRVEFAEHFELFISEESRKLYERTFDAG